MTQYFTEYTRFDDIHDPVIALCAPLHSAVVLNDESGVITLLESAEGADLYRSRLPTTTGNDWETLSMARSTPLHLALLSTHYELAERLINHEGLSDIMGLKNQCGTPLFPLITGLPDKQKALMLTQLALQRLQGAFDINATDGSRRSALHHACQDLDDNLVALLLENGASVNCCSQSHAGSGKTPLLEAASRLLTLGDADPSQRDTARRIIMRLLDNGANPSLRDTSGKTFFDYFNSEPLKELAGKGIRNRFDDWPTSTLFLIQKHRYIYNETYPLSYATHYNHFSPSLENTALLVNIKRERRLQNNQDYDCTVLIDKCELHTFLTLFQLQFAQTRQPRTTQFIIQPYVEINSFRAAAQKNVHVANAWLSIDEHGKVTVFWVDSLGAPGIDRILDNGKTISEIIKSCFPEANLYTVYDRLIRTNSGCHNFALYLSEQLSAVAYKDRSLVADLEAAYDPAKHGLVNGFMPIALEDCPVYTGVPKIVHSASKPLKRLQLDRESDRGFFSKKQETWQTTMERVIKVVDGKKTNTLSEIKRHRLGVHLTNALTELYETTLLAEKRLDGLTHIVDRIEPDILQKRYPCPITMRHSRCVIKMVHNKTFSKTSCRYATIDSMEADLDKLMAILRNNPGYQSNLLNRYAELRVAKAQVRHYRNVSVAVAATSASSSTFFTQRTQTEHGELSKQSPEMPF